MRRCAIVRLQIIAVIEAANAEDEALAVAVALREAVENGKTAALVTPDRPLARRVAAALARWNILADDSGGDALPDTEAGVFARLAAQAALEGLAPVPLLALMKHTRFRLGMAAGAYAHAVAALEMAVLRGPRPRPGSAGLAQALATFRANKSSLHRSDPRNENPRRRSQFGAGGGRTAPRSARATGRHQRHAAVHRDRRTACQGARCALCT